MSALGDLDSGLGTLIAALPDNIWPSIDEADEKPLSVRAGSAGGARRRGWSHRDVLQVGLYGERLRIARGIGDV